MEHTDLENQAAGVDQRRAARRMGRAAEDARLEMERLREVGQNLGAQIDEQVHKRPYVVAGVAAGLGFVAGSFLGSRLGQLILAGGIGFLVKSAMDGDFSAERLRSRLEKIAGSTEE
jgi:ElaB/YqjD/DUF883 family membrane-anchored ribosome-binding protein